MAVSASLLVILTVQAVPTLLSCLAFTSFSPLFFVGSVPFSLLFVTLSVLISVASWCWSPHEGIFSADENDAKYSSLYIDCSRVSSKLGNRSWWCCGEAPRGFQLAMLFLTWALLFLLLCMPPMANAEIGKVQADTERLPSFADGQEILEVTLEDSNDVETASQNVDSGGPEKRHEDVTSGPVLNNAVEEQISQQSSFDSSVDSYQSEAHSQAPDEKVELRSCRALVRAGQQVTCAAPDLAPALETDGSSELRDCSKESSGDGSSSLCIPDGPIFPSHLEFGQQPLHQRQVAFLTIMNSCNGSSLSLLDAKSDNRQFFVTGFSEKFLAPGGTLKFPVCYLPQYVGAARGSIIIETSTERLVVQLQGEGVASLYKMQVRVHEKSHYVISLFNPFNETLFVEEAVVAPEKDDQTSEERKRSLDPISLSTLENEIVIEAEEDCLRHDGESSQNQHGPLMRAGETWELPGQSRRDIVDFKICLNQGEVFRGSFQIRVTGPPLESEEITLVYPFSSRVSRPSPVLSVRDTLDFGVLVGDQASSQPLVLQNSGEQLVQVEDIYEVPGDSKIKIDYKKGQILLPDSETEVANVTYSGQNQPSESSACRRSQKIIVRTNSTIGHLIEIPYRAMVLQYLNSPPAMAFVTGSSGRIVGDLGGSHKGQGITDLLMDYKLFMGLLICGLLVSALVFFQVVVHDTELPTLSGDLGKGVCHRRSSSRVSPFIKKRDKIPKMWGWGALATVVDGIWTAFGSSLWTKDCNTPSPDYSLPLSVTPAQTPAPSATSPPKSSTGGSGASGAGSMQAGGRKGSADKKNNGAAKSEQSRNSKGNGETASGGLPVTARDSNHHPPSVKQPKTSKFLRPENTSAKYTICMEDSVDADSVVKDATVAVAPVEEIEPIQAIVPAQSTGPITDSSIKESPKNVTSTPSSAPVAPKTGSPCAPPVEREKRKRRKKSGRHDVASNLGTSGGVSPVSPASPITPSRSNWPVSPPSPDKKSDQSTASLSPRSSGSVDLPDPAPLPKLKVKVLNSLIVTNPAPATSVTESPRRSVAASTQLQPRLQGKVAEHRKQSPLERGGGPGVGKKSNISEWAAIARKKTPSTGFSKGSESGDGSHSYRASRHPHQRVGNNALAGSEDGPGARASFTTSASFPRLNSRPGGSWANSCDFGIDSFDTSVVPPPAIAPALRAPGAKITKQAPTGEPSWTSLGITASPELHDGRIDRELGGSSASWHASTSLSGQSSGELVYDIWGNHFGNLSQCSSNSEPSLQTGFEKEVDPVNSFHRLLVPDHLQQSEVSFPGTTGFVGDMSPTAAALYATHFKGFFSEGSTLGLDDSRPASPASVQDLPDQLCPIDGAGTSEISKLGFVGGQTFLANHVKPRVRVPYSPPMGCVGTTTFSTSAFSPLGTPTHALSSSSSASKHSFWAHDNSSLPERVVSPTLSLT